MTRMLCAAAALLLVSCSGDDAWDDCPHGAIKVRNASGLAHGQPCTQDSECMYGYCYKSAAVTRGQLGMCTKPCDCGEGSTCSTDGEQFTCARFSSSESMPSFCVLTCTSPADCPAGFNACAAPVGVRKFCVVE
ncbi:MAG: hypothetical protein FJ087_05235 [Deltaproteobacteria bacterium]|nr:hypothetical protein [Deltaproteobacteria bacterium]